MNETRNVPIEIIDLGSCDHSIECSYTTIPVEQVAPVFGVYLQRPLLRMTIESEKYGSRVIEFTVGSTRQEREGQTGMDMETWAEVIVLL